VSTAIQVLEAELDRTVPMPSLRRARLVAFLVVLTSVAAMLGWAIVTPLDRAVIASGALVAEGRRKTITLLDAGILRDLLVREGQTVVAGQPLLQLDMTQAEVAVQQALGQHWSQMARLARLVAEQQDLRQMQRPLGAPLQTPVVRAMLDAEERLFQARWAAYDGAVAVQQTRIAQLHEQAAAQVAQRTSISTRLQAIREELAGVSQLLRGGFATRTRQWELQRSEAELLGNLGQIQAQEAQTREQLAQARLELANLSLVRQQEVARDLQDASVQIAEAEQRLRAAQDVLMRREVLAPEAGTVTDLRFFTAGSSIGAGQPVLDLVPLDDRLVVEARVQPVDIEMVHAGQRARLRLNAFRTRELLPLEGHVIYVAADRAHDQQGNPYFLVRAELDPAAVAANAGLVLAAGMPVEAFLLGERRTIIDYLLHPLLAGMRRSLRD